MQQVQPVAPNDLVLGIHLHRLEKRIDGRTKAGHLGHGGGEILGRKGGLDSGLGRGKGSEKRFFLRCFREFHIRAIAVFDPIGAFGLIQDIGPETGPGKQREASREIAARATTSAGARPACSECEDRETVSIAADLVYKGPE